MNSPFPLFDTHAHLDLEQYESDRDAVVRRLLAGTFPGGLSPEGWEEQPIEIAGVLLPGIDLPSCRRVLDIATLSDRFHAAVAVHPNHTADVAEEDWHAITQLARQDNVVGIGETGLDRYWDNVPIDVQIDYLHRHIGLSLDTGKPILIHCREAWDDLMPILQQSRGLRGVIHAFSGNVEQMQTCVELGFYISFAGSVTYRNSKFSALWEAARQTPMDRLLIETDSPFMTPHPLRGKVQRNEPTLVALTALRLAELRSVPLRMITEATCQNAFQFLGLN